MKTVSECAVDVKKMSAGHSATSQAAHAWMSLLQAPSVALYEAAALSR